MKIDFKDLMKIDESIAPLGIDIVVYKRRVSVLMGSELFFYAGRNYCS